MKTFIRELREHVVQKKEKRVFRKLEFAQNKIVEMKVTQKKQEDKINKLESSKKETEGSEAGYSS